MLQPRMILPYLLSLAVAALMAVLNVPEMLGAHPWWAVKVIWIGLPIGAVLAFALAKAGLTNSLRSGVFVLVAIAAFYAAIHGKTVFVNSYAENAMAGKFWYFGWIATAAAICALIIALAQPWFRRP